MGSVTFPEISGIALAFLGITVAVYMFAVTLLGSAISRAQAEAEQTKKKQQADFDLKINDLQNKIKAAKVDQKCDELQKQLEEVQGTQKRLSAELKKIRAKYSRIELRKCVLLPGGLFLASVVLSLDSKLVVDGFSVGLWILSASALGLGIHRLYLSLALMEEISKCSEDLQAKRLGESFKVAMREVDEEKKEELVFGVMSPEFPYHCKPGSEIKVEFRVKLDRGRTAHKVEVQFFVPDGFTLVNPEEKESWRQREGFVVPNIRTVSCKVQDVRFGISSPGRLVIKAPTISGKYTLICSVISDETGARRETVGDIVVEG